MEVPLRLDRQEGGLDRLPVLPLLVVAVGDIAVGLGQVLGGHLDSALTAWWSGDLFDSSSLLLFLLMVVMGASGRWLEVGGLQLVVDDGWVVGGWWWTMGDWGLMVDDGWVVGDSV